MRYLLALLVLTAPVQAFAFEPNVNGYDVDFAHAKHCIGSIDGRQVWRGKEVYYVQAWWGFTPGQKIDPENVDVFPLKSLAKSDLKPFVEACK